MSLILMWAGQNKLATGLILVIVALLIALGFQTLRVKKISIQLDIAMSRLEAATVAIETLKVKAKAQEAKISESAKRIKRLAKESGKVTEVIRTVEVPGKCEEAVEWGTLQVNSLLRD